MGTKQIQIANKPQAVLRLGSSITTLLVSNVADS